MDDHPLWQPNSRAIENSQMHQFRLWINKKYQIKLIDYFELHHWSVKHLEEFWGSLAEFTEVILSKPTKQIFKPGKRMQDGQWFLGAELSFAENLLRFRDDKNALIFVSERGEEQTITYGELYQQVAMLADWLSKAGLNPGY